MISPFSKGLQLALNSGTSAEDPSNGLSKVPDTVNLVLRLLLSKDGVVVRRLVMTAVSSLLFHLFLSFSLISKHGPGGRVG